MSEVHLQEFRMESDGNAEGEARRMNQILASTLRWMKKHPAATIIIVVVAYAFLSTLKL